MRSLTGLQRELDGVAGDALAAFLDRCVRDRLMLPDGDRYLSLAVTTPARAWHPTPGPVAAAAA